MAKLDYEALFNASANAYAVLDRDLRFVSVNEAYLAATGQDRAALVGKGKGIFDIFPHDDSVDKIARSLEHVVASRQADVVPLFHAEDRSWSAIHTPIIGADGAVEHVLQHLIDLSEKRARVEAVEERNIALDQGVQRLAAILEQSPGFLAFLRGPDHVFELLSPAYDRLIGHRDVLGKPIREALPEIDPAFFELIDRVYASGELFVGHSMPVAVDRGGALATVFVDFIYQPIFGADGEPTGVLVSGNDITEQRQAEADRAQLLENERTARAEAEQANELKDQFLATVSHELRTPLTSMLGWMQMLRSGMVPPDKQARALETVERNARIQAQLIDDLLDVSRIISGKLSFDSEPVEIAGVVAAAVETVRPMSETAGVAVAADVDTASIVVGDGRRLEQVVWNLLANAVKFTPRGGRVRLQVERVGDSVEIAVTDTGVGIAPELLPHVFEAFRQAERGSARKKGGLGLGLSIVRHVVEAHGGRVRAHSDGDGKGARFVVRLPLAGSASMPFLAARPERDLSALPALAGAHILVVDDDEDTREYLRALLDRCQARVTVAASAAEALAAIELQPPDVLVSDLGMPVEDGYMLIRRVRALPRQRGGATPAVALTAFAQIEDRARAMRAGFQDHVTKPVKPDELVSVLAALVGR